MLPRTSDRNGPAMPLSEDHLAVVVALVAQATRGTTLTAAQTGPLRAWRLNASPAEAETLDQLINPTASPPPSAAYAAGQRRAAAVNARPGGAA